MPPHLYGELTRTMEGCEVLAKRKVVTDLLNRAHQLYNVCTMLPSAGRNVSAVEKQSNRAEIVAAFKDLQAVMWSLGHIGSNELGCALILEADRKFIVWCIEAVCSCPYYSLRGTFFYVLGLISRTQQGSRRLLKHGWDSAPRDGNSAVAFPLRASSLFRYSGAAHVAIPGSPRGQGSPHNNVPFSMMMPPQTSPVTRGRSGGASTAPNSSVAPVGLNISTAGMAMLPRNAALSPSHQGVMSPTRMNTLPESVLSHLNVYHRTSLAQTKNLDIEVLHLIAKVGFVACVRARNLFFFLFYFHS